MSATIVLTKGIDLQVSEEELYIGFVQGTDEDHQCSEKNMIP